MPYFYDKSGDLQVLEIRFNKTCIYFVCSPFPPVLVKLRKYPVVLSSISTKHINEVGM